ncbi:MAG: type I-E CRISPR-associated protein Cse1/CasA [Candidatus Lokiarchaeota archaeon]|nr:type I-E CRISPR-associated protein Cse1/CasA [Candidatus Lokiarchaeota archaeon]
MSEISFNLLEDPWIPCMMKSNEYNTLSIKDCLFNANEVSEISSNNPLIVISVHRFLLAFLHKNYGPKNAREWSEIYSAGHWNGKKLDQYFEKWKHRFELFNEPENRFYQIKPNTDRKTPITKLNYALSSGNNTALFDHNWDSDIHPMDVENVAQLLITFQNYAVGGGRSKPFYYSDAPLISGIVTLLKGKDLFETLMLNFIRYDEEHPFIKSDDHPDIPFWERDDRSLCQDKDGRYPYGYLDYLTWQSRRIWLIPIKDEGKIKVKNVIMAQGEKVSSEWNEDPQKIYKLDKKNERKQIKVLPDRKVWRDIEALIRLNDSTSNFISPKAINWIARNEIIPNTKRFNLEIYGVCHNKAKISSWHRSYIPLPLKFLDDQNLVADVKTFIDKCEKIEKILTKTVKLLGKEYLFPDNPSISKNQWNKVWDFINNLQIRIKYWNFIEQYFYKFINEIPQEPDFNKRQMIIKKWINDKVIRIASDLLNKVKINIREDPRALKSYVLNTGYFFKNIKALK